eukprot:TRINITY_DN29938_c0_g1_i1.p1 TRINITY_DN29938_c0_g1~~TRINITY_DN29938_c0_g1_i1.p1  ORF type:complete len:484 (+),score=89.31 TRINITY_DN29938_c0_g1_i1:320-1771(+)
MALATLGVSNTSEGVSALLCKSMVNPTTRTDKPPARGVHAVDWSALKEIRHVLTEKTARKEDAAVDEISGGEDCCVSSQELAECWLEVASAEQHRQGSGPLTARDKEFIEVRVSQSMREVDPKCTDRVDKDEWVHHMLLTRSSPRTMRGMMQMNALLDTALDRCPGILVGLQHAFEVAVQAVLERESGAVDLAETTDVAEDGLSSSHAGNEPTNGSGTSTSSTSSPVGGSHGAVCMLSIFEILEVFGRKLWHLRPPGNETSRHSPNFFAGTTDEFIRETIKAMDLDSCAKIGYAEFLALGLGRRERPVALHLYDLSRGAAAALAPYLIQEELQGVWHTGIVVFGKEYYFGGDIYYDTPSKTGFGPPRRVILLGYTLRQREELHAFIVDELKPMFSREAYDAARNNCNHFTDRLSLFLVGKHIPEEVLRQPQLMMNTSLGRALRPFLTRWLGLYFEAPKTAAEVSYDAVAVKASDLPVDNTISL